MPVPPSSHLSRRFHQRLVGGEVERVAKPRLREDDVEDGAAGVARVGRASVDHAVVEGEDRPAVEERRAVRQVELLAVNVRLGATLGVRERRVRVSTPARVRARRQGRGVMCFRCESDTRGQHLCAVSVSQADAELG